jgi:D-alanyl-lipoteichoic acid acyltransferase DltB (MBOAT superfamily)
MLFNSYTFIFLFLPAVLLGYIVIGALLQQWAAAWLVAASLVFYAYWDPRYLSLLLISAVVNFFAGRGLAECPPGQLRRRRLLLALSIGFNLLLLGYFKYANFFIANLADATGLEITIRKVILPLGISFFTFTQIAFLVDAYRGEAREPKFVHYLLFVTYFPHLIAGPILHHKEMMPQFAQPETYRFNAANLVTGCVIFIIGLFKKAVLADGVAHYVSPIFDAAAKGQHFLIQDAWGGALAYTFQLYFDFSGYCDMAIGASLMFGIALPLNFNSPYKSRSIVEFWRRWHMTLSRFLRDYLYIPLGGNRKGGARRYINLFLTMLLGGLWHGAGWTFVIWGALHGLYLAINHAFSVTRARLGLIAPSRIGSAASWLVTFLAVVVGWVFFRAESWDSALHILAGMANITQCSVPGACGLDAGFFHAADSQAVLVWVWCAVLLAIAIAAPNTQEIMRDRLSGLTRPAETARLFGASLAFRSSRVWAAAVGVLLAIGLACLPQPTSFLYFNF